MVLNAFREANDALVGYRKGNEAYTARSKRTQSLRTYARLSRARYEGGSSGYLEVLYAENELFAAELSAVDALLLRNLEGVLQLVAEQRDKPCSRKISTHGDTEITCADDGGREL